MTSFVIILQTWPQPRQRERHCRRLDNNWGVFFYLKLLKLLTTRLVWSSWQHKGPQCRQIIIATNDGPMPPTRFLSLVNHASILQCSWFLTYRNTGWMRNHRCYRDFCRCPSLRHLCLESWGEDGESGGVSSGNSVRGSRHLSVVVFGRLSIRIFHRARRSSFKGFGFKFRDSRARGERRGVDLLLRLQTILMRNSKQSFNRSVVESGFW